MISADEKTKLDKEAEEAVRTTCRVGQQIIDLYRLDEPVDAIRPWFHGRGVCKRIEPTIQPMEEGEGEGK